MKLLNIISTLLLFGSGSAHASMSTSYQSEIYRACMGNTLPVGTLCFEKNYTGQTNFNGPYGPNLVTAKIHVRINKPDYTQSSLNYNPTFTILEINDTNNLFQPLSDLTVYAKAVAQGFHRPPTFDKPAAQATINLFRSYGSTVFTNPSANALKVPLGSNFGSEYVEDLQKIEIYFPGQPYALTIPL